MQTANVNDRASIEALYPRAAFDEDAAKNALPKTQVLYGVRIDSEPDEGGSFALVRARHHVGEMTNFAEAVFLFPEEPHLSATLVGSDPDAGMPQEADDPSDLRRKEYEAFIDRVLDAARRADFADPIGRDEERLKGFHGG